METKNVMIVGVGGQGSLLASKLLGALLIGRGYDVKVSEVHGMSQRGGSVVTYVRFGDKVCSPVISTGEADFIVSFEQLEAARYLDCLKQDGKIIVNAQKQGVFVDSIDALALAQQAGNAKSVNIVLMGRLAKYFDIPYDAWIDEIRRIVKPQFVDVNLKAFELGYNF